MHQLLYGDWATEGALRFNEGLASQELSGSNVLADAKTLLGFVASEGPVKETAAQYLPPAVVASLLPSLRMPTGRHAVEEREPTKEGDLLWLSPLRHTLIFGGLLVRRKGLRITTLGRQLLVAGRTGELYAHLFRTFFRKLDLRSLDANERHPGLQSTLPYSFYKLRTAARDWSSPESLAEMAWLESAKEPLSEWEASSVDLRFYTFLHRVLDPLVQFGLLEEHVLPSEDRWKESVEFRASPLFGQFMHFEFVHPRHSDIFLMS